MSISRGSGVGGDLSGEREEAVVVLPMAETTTTTLIARRAGARHAARDVPDLLGVGDRGAAVFLDDQRHGSPNPITTPAPTAKNAGVARGQR